MSWRLSKPKTGSKALAHSSPDRSRPHVTRSDDGYFLSSFDPLKELKD
jgi:hypothetical protein